jgi:hypothetical protein
MENAGRSCLEQKAYPHFLNLLRQIIDSNLSIAIKTGSNRALWGS